MALTAVIFAETGLLVGFFLPGDSLLVTAGLFCTSASTGEAPLLNIVVAQCIRHRGRHRRRHRRLLDRREVGTEAVHA